MGVGGFEQDRKQFVDQAERIMQDDAQEQSATGVTEAWLTESFSSGLTWNDLEEKYSQIEQHAGLLAQKYDLSGEGLVNLDGQISSIQQAKNAYEKAWNNAEKYRQEYTWLSEAGPSTGVIIDELLQANQVFLENLRLAYERKYKSTNKDSNKDSKNNNESTNNGYLYQNQNEITSDTGGEYTTLDGFDDILLGGIDSSTAAASTSIATSQAPGGEGGGSIEIDLGGLGFSSLDNDVQTLLPEAMGEDSLMQNAENSDMAMMQPGVTIIPTVPYHYTLPASSFAFDSPDAPTTYAGVAPSILANHEKMREDWECTNPLLTRFQGRANCAGFVQSTLRNIVGTDVLRAAKLEQNGRFTNAWHILKKLEQNGFAQDVRRYDSVQIVGGRIKHTKPKTNELVDMVTYAKDKPLSLMGLYTIGTNVSHDEFAKKSADPSSHVGLVFSPKTRTIVGSSGTVGDAIVDFFMTQVKNGSRATTKQHRDLLGTLDNVYVTRNNNKISLTYNQKKQEFVDQKGVVYTLQKGDSVSYDAVQYSDYIVGGKPRNRMLELAAILMVENFRIPSWQTTFNSDRISTQTTYQDSTTGASIEYSSMITDYMTITASEKIAKTNRDNEVKEFFLKSSLGKKLFEHYYAMFPQQKSENTVDYEQRITRFVTRSIEYYRLLGLIQADALKTSSYYGFSYTSHTKFPLIDWPKKDAMMNQYNKSKKQAEKLQRREKIQQAGDDFSTITPTMLSAVKNQIEAAYNLGSTRALNAKLQIFMHQCIIQLQSDNPSLVDKNMEEYLTIPIVGVRGQKTKLLLPKILEAYGMIPSAHKLNNAQFLFYLVNHHHGLLQRYGKQEIILTTSDLDGSYVFDKSLFRSKRSERLENSMNFAAIFSPQGTIDEHKLLREVWPEAYKDTVTRLLWSLEKNKKPSGSLGEWFTALKKGGSTAKELYKDAMTAVASNTMDGTFIQKENLSYNRSLIDALPLIVKTINTYSPSKEISETLIKTLIHETGYIDQRYTVKQLVKTIGLYDIQSEGHFQVRANTFCDCIRKLGYDQHHPEKKKFQQYLAMSSDALEELLANSPEVNTIAAIAITIANASDLKKQIQQFTPDDFDQKIHRRQAANMTERFFAKDSISLAQARSLADLPAGEIPDKYQGKIIKVQGAKEPDFNLNISQKSNISHQERTTKNLLQEYCGGYPPRKDHITLHGAALNNRGLVNAGYRDANFPFAILDNGIILQFFDESQGTDASGAAGMVQGDPLSLYTGIGIEFAGEINPHTGDVYEPNQFQLTARRRLRQYLQRKHPITSVVTSAQAVQDNNGQFVTGISLLHTDTETWNHEVLGVSSDVHRANIAAMSPQQQQQFVQKIEGRILLARHKAAVLELDTSRPGREESYRIAYLERIRGELGSA